MRRKVKNIFLTIALFILVGCHEAKNEKIKINKINYISPERGDETTNNGSSENVVTMCDLVESLQDTTLVIAQWKETQQKTEDICSGGVYSTAYYIHTLEVIQDMNGVLDQNIIHAIEIGGGSVAGGNYQENEYGIFKIKKDRENYFVLGAIKIGIQDFEDQSEEGGTVFNLPDNVEDLEKEYKDFSENLDRHCAHQSYRTEEEWQRATYGDPSRCEGDGSQELCREDNPNPPACCYDDTAPIECCSPFPPANCLQ